jgi:hypothetical protein
VLTASFAVKAGAKTGTMGLAGGVHGVSRVGNRCAMRPHSMMVGVADAFAAARRSHAAAR